MLRSGKELKVFTVKKRRLKEVHAGSEEIRRTLLRFSGQGNKDPNAEVDVIARAEDASKISRIVERFNLASVDTASIVTEAENRKMQRPQEKKMQGKGRSARARHRRAGKGGERQAHGRFDGQAEKKPPNPSLAKTEKSPLSEPTLKQQRKSAEGATMTKAEKPSVREELRKIKESRKEQEADPLQKRNLPTGQRSRPQERRSITAPEAETETKIERSKISMSIYDVFSGGSRAFNKEEWAAQSRTAERSL